MPEGHLTPIPWNVAGPEVRAGQCTGLNLNGCPSVDFGRQTKRSEAIARLNDRLRKEGRGGRLVVTQGVHGLPSFDARALIAALAAYDHFDADNDPFGERDFGALEYCGARLFWKIDYYDLDLEYGSEDPTDPAVTTRVLTVMLQSEY